MNEIRRRLRSLRQVIRGEGLDAYLVPGTDPHQSEYVPDCWQRRRWVSGFSGSAGDVLITRRSAGLWTDGRYRIQAARQLAHSGIELFVSGHEGVPTLPVWAGQALSRGQRLGVDPQLLTPLAEQLLRGELARKGAQLVLLRRNLVDRIWNDQPPLPTERAHPHPRRFAGESLRSKLGRLRGLLADSGADALPLVALDEIAWLFNLRGADINYNPLLIAYGLVTATRALLFCAPSKLSAGLQRQLEQAGVEVYDYQRFGAALGQLTRARGRQPRVWVDERRISSWVLRRLGRCPLHRATSPVARIKARKNTAEIAGARSAQLRDGVAMVRFLCWLERSVVTERLTELDVARKLRALRAEGALFRGESFAPIVGYGANAAIVHYAAGPRSNARLRPRGLLLVDSGGQYADGTTDITRTILLGGRASRAQRARFTQVLRGHIALAQARFPRGTTGQQLDALARVPLWQAGADYAHGTGHGVGAYLGVHEGPQSIGKRGSSVALEAGNILSNEPGYYEAGAYGIRIENLLLVAPDERLSRGDSRFLRFEVLTLCPIDRRLIEPTLLTTAERSWLDDYHARVRRALLPHLEGAERGWLRQATAARDS